jgi:IS30 family transposase
MPGVKDHSRVAFRFILAAHNDKPRKCLAFKTPAEVFDENLKATVALEL